MKRIILIATFFFFCLSILRSQTQAGKSKSYVPKLERKIAWPDSTVYLPYTTLCFIQGAALPQTYGWMLESEIQASESSSLLIMEMSASDLFDEPYSSGSVQVIFEIPDFQNSYEIKMQSWKIPYRLINNYGGISGTDDSMHGTLTIQKDKNEIKLNGSLKLVTKNPYTLQVMKFNLDIIQSYNLESYQADLLANKKRDSLIKIDSVQMKIFLDELWNYQYQMRKYYVTSDTFPIHASDLNSSSFFLIYNTIGLGSSQFYPERIKLFIQDTVLKCGVMKRSSEIQNIDFATGDTTWLDKRFWSTLYVPKALLDSIKLQVQPYEGKYVFYDNPDVMSGSISEFYIQCENRCASFSWKNTTSETEYNLVRLLNQYLPGDAQLYCGFKIYTEYLIDTNRLIRRERTEDSSESPIEGEVQSFPFESTHTVMEPLIQDCKGWNGKNKIDYWGQEYDLLRNQPKDRIKK